MVETNGGRFSTDIPLKKGLNIVRAENSSGKSTCVNAIAYGLGLEPILGPRSKRPFPKSLYDEILDKKTDEESDDEHEKVSTKYHVKSSQVQLSISNTKGDKALIKRDILGDTNKVTVIANEESFDFFLGTSGTIGASKSERGFHFWLERFIEWNLPNVVTFEGNETKLYLECIFPLFFIEQKRGWSEIQANTPTTYGIKNVKRAAIEFCLGIDSFEHEKKLTHLKNKIDSSEQEWESLRSTAEGIADFNRVILNKIPEIKKYKDDYDINFQFQDGDASYSVKERQDGLKKYISQLESDISSHMPRSELLASQQTLVRNLRRDLSDLSEQTELSVIAIHDIDTKLTTLITELDKYRQLRKLKNVGGVIPKDLDTSKCPICESELYDTLGNRTVKREPMTLDENIEFLKNQTEFYTNIKLRNTETLKYLQGKLKLAEIRLNKELDNLENIKRDLDDINGETKAIIREKIQAEMDLRAAGHLADSLVDLRSQASRIISQWKTATTSLKKLKGGVSDSNKVNMSKALLSLIRTNLRSFKFTPNAIDSITLSNQTFRPEQEGYDIVAETSASDYIRIIWAYTLALLQLAGKESDVLHGGFIVFDEPRQHEASYVSFASLISKAAESETYNGQVIFATSLDKAELDSSCEGMNVNVLCFDDYILQLEEDKQIGNEEIDVKSKSPNEKQEEGERDEDNVKQDIDDQSRQTDEEGNE